MFSRWPEISWDIRIGSASTSNWLTWTLSFLFLFCLFSTFSFFDCWSQLSFTIVYYAIHSFYFRQWLALYISPQYGTATKTVCGWKLTSGWKEYFYLETKVHEIHLLMHLASLTNCLQVLNNIKLMIMMPVDLYSVDWPKWRHENPVIF